MSAAVGVSVATVWTSPDAPRDLDALAVADQPDMPGWTRLVGTEARLGLNGRTLTQGLLGEPVEVIEEQGDWAEVVLPWQPSSLDPRGYRGWIRHAHLAEETETTGPRVVVTVPIATTETSLALSFGTILPLLEAVGEESRLALPGGGSITVGPAAVRPVDAPLADAQSILASARQFLGLPYLWGGASGWGMDCSGFVHLIHRVAGITIPRDAFDQADASQPRDLDDAAEGDLYFFARPGKRPYHVGFATRGIEATRRTMLHAPEAGDAVRIEDAPLAPHRAETLVSAGTFLA